MTSSVSDDIIITLGDIISLCGHSGQWCVSVNQRNGLDTLLLRTGIDAPLCTHTQYSLLLVVLVLVLVLVSTFIQQYCSQLSTDGCSVH